MSRRVIIDELEFEVAYGKIAAKSWHEDDDQCKRVLALHGWMDNSGSFDMLIPQLKHDKGLYVVALDLPGHGKSSQLPPGMSYCDLAMVMEIRRCLIELGWAKTRKSRYTDTDEHNNHMLNSESRNNSSNNLENELTKLDLKREAQANVTSDPIGATVAGAAAEPEQRKFSIIGHSLGAGLGLFYSSLFPDEVEEVILLDFLKTRTTSSIELLENTADIIDRFLTTVPAQSPFSSPIISRSKPSASNLKTADKGQVVVSQETAIIATIEAHKQLGALSREDAACLLKRSTVAVSTPPNSVIYSRDLRLQAMLNMREHWDMNKIMFARVRCHVFAVISKRGIYAEDDQFRDHMDEMEALLRSQSKSFHIQWVDADHYLHMNKAKDTAELVNKFLQAPSDYHLV